MYIFPPATARCGGLLPVRYACRANVSQNLCFFNDFCISLCIEHTLSPADRAAAEQRDDFVILVEHIDRIETHTLAA